MDAKMRISGSAVRALREQKSWSQDHLATAAGLNVRTVQRVECGGGGSAGTGLALAAALDVPVGTLMEREEASSAPAEIETKRHLQSRRPRAIGDLVLNLAALIQLIGFVVMSRLGVLLGAAIVIFGGILYRYRLKRRQRTHVTATSA